MKATELIECRGRMYHGKHHAFRDYGSITGKDAREYVLEDSDGNTRYETSTELISAMCEVAPIELWTVDEVKCYTLLRQ